MQQQRDHPVGGELLTQQQQAEQGAPQRTQVEKQYGAHYLGQVQAGDIQRKGKTGEQPGQQDATPMGDEIAKAPDQDGRNNSVLAPKIVGPVQKASTPACSMPRIGIQ